MGYKKISHKSKEGRGVEKCIVCGHRFIREPGDDSKTCPPCVEHLLQPCKPSPITEVA